MQPHLHAIIWIELREFQKLGAALTLRQQIERIAAGIPGVSHAHNISVRRHQDIETHYHVSLEAEVASETPVGEAHVVGRMLEVDAVIGGEGNGGVILPALHAGRDAMVGMALILQSMAEGECTLGEALPGSSVHDPSVRVISTEELQALVFALGTGLSPLRYLELGMNPEWLRYYIAAKLNARVEDLDFNPEDFIARVNSDLVGKFINIASRTAWLSPRCRRPAPPPSAEPSATRRAP